MGTLEILKVELLPQRTLGRRFSIFLVIIFGTLVVPIFFFSAASFSEETLRSSQNEKFSSEENLTGVSEDVATDSTINQLDEDPKPESPPKDHFPTVLGLVSQPTYFSRHAFVADKSRRTLSVWRFTAAGPQFIEAHAIDKGKVDGDKHVLGDKKTPEGIYFFTQSYSGQQLDYNEYGSRAFVMDYPNFFDRKQNKTGSGIWLHAVPDSKSLLRGSRGCVVVRDEIVQKLANYIDIKKTPIIVVNRADYLPLLNYPDFNQTWKDYLESWRSSWESQDIDAYISFYHDDFESQGKSKAQWREYKQGLATSYNYIRVKVLEPMVFVHKDSAVIRFLQDYESNKNSDFGEKTLYLKQDKNNFKIINETWLMVKNDQESKISDVVSLTQEKARESSTSTEESN